MQKSTFVPLTGNSLVFIDPGVEDYHSLMTGVKPETEVVLLDPGGDGVAQISAALAGRTAIKSVHIVSHGSPGAMRLGNTQLCLDTMDRYRSQLQQWRDVLSEDADLLLYGCNVAQGERGVTYLERLKSLIGAEIAASTNLTGSAARGGDWNLAVTTGKIGAPLAFEPEAMAAYAEVLSVRVLGTPQVSEDNVPDPLGFQLVLEQPPSADVTISFTVDETQLQAIAPITFTPENWNITQIPVVSAYADGVAEGNEQTSAIGITVTSADSEYDGLAVNDVIAEITDNAIPGFISYRTVEGTFRDLSQLAVDNSNIASWIDIGDSYDKVTPGGAEGYDIYALKLTNKSTDGHEPKPALYVQGSLHAREYTTAELVTRFAEELVAGYGKNADSTWLLDYFEIHVVPIANPDGRKFAEQGYSWRKNTNPNPPPGAEPAPFPTYGVDLNRNYDSRWGQIPGGSSGNPRALTYRGTSAFSEPETQTLSNYVLSLFPDQRGPNDTDAAPDDATGVYLDIHSSGNLVLYPWGWTFDPAPNQEDLRTLGRKFGYFSGVDGQAYDVDQAVGLYPTDGASDDWTYETLGVAAYTFELGTAFFQNSEYFENTIVPELTPALFYAAKSAYRPYQTAAGPDSIDLKVDLAQVTAGTPILLEAIADDTRYNDGILEETDPPEPIQSIASARYTIDAPSWVEGVEFYYLSALDGTFDSSVETLQATIDTTGLAPGHHKIFVESQDADGNFGVPTAVFFEVFDSSDYADIFEGTSDSDTLVGSSGDELLRGGAGSDTFVLAAGSGTDTIRDFQISEDLIALAGGLTFGQLSITQDGSNTLVGFGKESLAILTGLQANTLIDSASTAFTVV